MAPTAPATSERDPGETRRPCSQLHPPGQALERTLLPEVGGSPSNRVTEERLAPHWPLAAPDPAVREPCTPTATALHPDAQCRSSPCQGAGVPGGPAGGGGHSRRRRHSRIWGVCVPCRSQGWAACWSVRRSPDLGGHHQPLCFPCLRHRDPCLHLLLAPSPPLAACPAGLRASHTLVLWATWPGEALVTEDLREPAWVWGLWPPARTHIL